MEIHETGELFDAVQLKPVFPDSKTFPDCVPKRNIEAIQKEFLAKKETEGFNLKKFIIDNFDLPVVKENDFVSDKSKSTDDHIVGLWRLLTREPNREENGSLISLPYSYIVPGGRFGEIYYWDSYFTMLGLKVSGHVNLIQHMIDNFSYLIDKIGYIPNGNRTYYLGRSQPPFFALMLSLLADCMGEAILTKYITSLENEYRFWMHGASLLSPRNKTMDRVVMISDNEILNRYWDANNTPRPEAYKEDIELAHHSKTNAIEIFRHIRAAAESGWDFSSRWFKDTNSFNTIHTTDIIPVDLNCLLWYMENLLATLYLKSGRAEDAKSYRGFADKRKIAINKFCWNEQEGFYYDYDFISQKFKQHLTLAGMFPLFFQLANPQQAAKVCMRLSTDFLKPGGLATTLFQTGQQWDAPNGWAPLQWVSYVGCKNYGYGELAGKIKSAWIQTNDKVYRETGKMMEKYNVMGSGDAGGGGEYPNQDGFGWTNGVYLALKAGL